MISRGFAKDWVVPSMPVNVSALTTSRTGGFSEGKYASFNLANHVGEDNTYVQRNREFLSKTIGCSRICWLEQEHGSTCVVVGGQDLDRTMRGDAAYTEESDVALAVLTADCVPVVMAGEDGRGIAIVHAGWRGIEKGVIDEAFARFRLHSPSQVVAWIGPAIGQNNYEVGPEVMAAICDNIKDSRRFFVSVPFPQFGEKRYFADLSGIVKNKLTSLGISKVSGGEICCFANENFYSYRRDGITGRMATVVWRGK